MGKMKNLAIDLENEKLTWDKAKNKASEITGTSDDHHLTWEVAQTLVDFYYAGVQRGINLMSKS